MGNKWVTAYVHRYTLRVIVTMSFVREREDYIGIIIIIVIALGIIIYQVLLCYDVSHALQHSTSPELESLCTLVLSA